MTAVLFQESSTTSWDPRPGPPAGYGVVDVPEPAPVVPALSGGSNAAHIGD